MFSIMPSHLACIQIPHRYKILVTLRVGFEPTREDPIGFQVQRLNHSAIAARLIIFSPLYGHFSGNITRELALVS